MMLKGVFFEFNLDQNFVKIDAMFDELLCNTFYSIIHVTFATVIMEN